MICNNCGEELVESQYRWAFDEVYCEECFDNQFNYCCRCDGVIYRDSVHYNDEGDPYCDECYRNDYDDDAPNDPMVNEEDRKLIVTLSRNSLKWISSPRRLINVNKRDNYVNEIRSLVGFVEKPLYLYGLHDRDEFQIECTDDMISQVEHFRIQNFPDVKVVISSGARRLGISYSLRKSQRHLVVNLINKLCYGIDLKMDEHFIIKMEEPCAE